MTTLLRPGSPAAQAVHGLMSTHKLVTLDCPAGADRLLAACEAISYLAGQSSYLDVMFLADDPLKRSRLARKIQRRLSLLDSPLSVRKGDDDELSAGRVNVCAAEDPKMGRLVADLLVIDPEFVRSSAIIYSVDWTKQTLLTVSAPDLEEACRRQSLGVPPSYWGEIPLEVTLAGAPS